MGTLMRAATLLCLLLAATASTPALAQPVPDDVGKLLGPPLADAADVLIPTAEAEAGEDLHSERIDLDIQLDIVQVTYGLVPILFGGGRIGAQAIATVGLDFHAVSLERLDDVMQSVTGEANVTAAGTLGIPTNRTVLTAEEIRILGGGALLDAFQDAEAEAAKRLMEETVPGMVVLSSRFDWSNTVPLLATVERYRQDPVQASRDPLPDLRGPPLHLEAVFHLEFSDHVSLYGLLEPRLEGSDAAGDARRALRDRVEKNETVPFLDQSAFAALGFGQILHLTVPPGWRMAVQATVPEGFSFEEASSELALSPNQQNVTFAKDGGTRDATTDDVGLIVISSRFLVVSVLLVAILIAGVAARVSTEIVVLAVKRRANQRRRRRESHLGS